MGRVVSLGAMAKAGIEAGCRLICPVHDRVCDVTGTLTGRQGHWLDKQTNTLCVPAGQEEEAE